MTSLVELSFSPAFLTHCLNAALASTVACAMAIALWRRQAWSLPVRHGVLVAALIVSLAAPLLLPLVKLPSLFTVEVAEKVDGSRTSAEPAEAAAVRPRPVSDLPDSAAVSVTANDDSQATVPIAASTSPPAVVSPSRPAPVPARPPSSATELLRPLGTLLCVVWLAGIFFAIGRAIVFLARFKRWQPTIVTADSPPLLEAARWAARRAGLRHEIAIFRCDALPAPVTFGLFRPRVVVPSDIESDVTPDQLRVVLLHEMAHIARRDLWIGLLQQAAQIVAWWNPLVRRVNRRLSDLREQICDDIATRELPRPGEYAATLIRIAERCVERLPVPATLGIGSSPAGQLEIRIRRIVSSPCSKCFRLNRRAAMGVLATAVLMAATALFAQVRVAPRDRPARDSNDASGGAGDVKAGAAATRKRASRTQPSLDELIERIAVYERAYMPYQVKVMNTFEMSDGLSPRQRAKYPWADGHKHQRLMEYAQLKPRVWRTKETHLVDDVAGRPSESYSDGNRLIQTSRRDADRGDGSEILRVIIKHDPPDKIQPYRVVEPIYGVFCLSSYSNAVLFSEAVRDDALENLELAWDGDDAKLSFAFGPGRIRSRFELWLSRDHAWHPIRLRRYFGADKQYHDEWEATEFVERNGQWHIGNGTHRYRDNEERSSPDSKVVYSTNFQVLEAVYGDAVDEKRFDYEIPAEAEVDDDEKPKAEPPPPAETRAITVRVVDVADRPVPNARVKFRAVLSLQVFDVVMTDEQGVAKSSKPPRENVSLEIEATGFRPAGWVMGTAGNEMRAFLVPNSPGWTVDERNRPVAEAWITNEPTTFRADGVVRVPDRRQRRSEGGWSASDGAFELHSELTVRRPDALLPYIAVDEAQEMMAIDFVRADRLGQAQTLVLQPVHGVRGRFLLEGMSEAMQIGLTLETRAGERIAGVGTKPELAPDGLWLDFQLRLPPGEYVLKSRASSRHSDLSTAFSLKAGDGDLDLGTKAIPATGLVALRGKPAPQLEVAWRAGQETTWEKLRGKVVVLDFWGTWCIPCVAAMPMLMDIREQFRDQPVEWLTIHTANVKGFDELDRQLATCQERNWNDRELPFTTLIDLPAPDETYSGKTSQRYGIAEWPTLVVVDQRGKIVGAVQKEKLAEAIRRLLQQASDPQP